MAGLVCEGGCLCACAITSVGVGEVSEHSAVASWPEGEQHEDQDGKLGLQE